MDMRTTHKAQHFESISWSVRSLPISASEKTFPDGLYAYRLTRTSRTVVKVEGNNPKTATGRQAVEGFCTGKGLEAMRNGSTGHAPDARQAPVLLVTDDFFTLMREEGPGADNLHEKIQAATVKNPYTALTKGHANRIIRMAWDSHRVFDIWDQPVPVAIYFGYIEAGMHNVNYDLRKAHAILAARPDIKLYGPRHSCDIAVKDTLIQNIPGYNCDGGRTQSLEFRWMPTVEDYCKLSEWIEQNGRKTYPWGDKFVGIFELDLLGLRAGGAAKFKTFYGQYEARDD